MTTTVGNVSHQDLTTVGSDGHKDLTAVEEALVAEALWNLATGVLQIPPSQDHYFVHKKPGSDKSDKSVRKPGDKSIDKSSDKSGDKPDDDLLIIPLPPPLNETYSLKWANPTRIGGGAGVAYSLDVIARLKSEPSKARTRHLYITYMEEAGPSRCRTALASAIQQLGPILYTAEADARECREADEELRVRNMINIEKRWDEERPLEDMDEGTPMSEDVPMDEESDIEEAQ